MKKRILAALLALGCALLVFTGCGSKKDTTPKNYTQIIHDAREAEDNDYYMIFSPAEDGKFTAQYGYSASYPADDLNDEIQNMLLPLLDLPEGSYTDLAASLSAKVATVPTGEVIMVCCENSDAVMNAIKTALAA